MAKSNWLEHFFSRFDKIKHAQPKAQSEPEPEPEQTIEDLLPPAQCIIAKALTTIGDNDYTLRFSNDTIRFYHYRLNQQPQTFRGKISAQVKNQWQTVFEYTHQGKAHKVTRYRPGNWEDVFFFQINKLKKQYDQAHPKPHDSQGAEVSAKKQPKKDVNFGPLDIDLAAYYKKHPEEDPKRD